MTSHGYLPGLVLPPQQGMRTIPKGNQVSLSNFESSTDVRRLGSLNMKPYTTVAIDNKHIRPTLIELQGPNSIHFSSGIAKQCIKRREILKLLMYVPNDSENNGMFLPKLSELVDLHELTSNMPQEHYNPERGLYLDDAEFQPTIFYPNTDFYTQQHISHFMEDLAYRSQVIVHPDGRLLITGSEAETNNIISNIANIYSADNMTKSERKSMIVPYFDRLAYRARRSKSQVSSSTLPNVKFSPAKSIEKTTSTKKKGTRKTVKEKEIYRKSHSYAVECLLSIMVDKKRNGKATLVALKKCGPELPQLLTHLSASVAGTGLAILFFAVFKAGSNFPASKIVTAGFGFGMIWVSMAMQKLRDAIVKIIKSSSKSEVKDEGEMIKKLDLSVNEIYLRASMLMAVGVMRLVV
jgi:hypothetical protein